MRLWCKLHITGADLAYQIRPPLPYLVFVAAPVSFPAHIAPRYSRNTLLDCGSPAGSFAVMTSSKCLQTGHCAKRHRFLGSTATMTFAVKLKSDVAVIGAGPSGAAAAAYLARDGFDVLLMDRARFPRDKVCGDGLAPRSVEVLSELGIDTSLGSLGYRPLRLFRVVSSRGDSVVAGFPRYGRGGDQAFVVPRIVLDKLLVDAASALGARVLEAAEAVQLLDSGSGSSPVVLRARTDDGQECRVEAGVLIVADGSRGSFSRSILGPTRTRPSCIGIRAYAQNVPELDGKLHFFLDPTILPGGYGWIFPSSHPDGPVNLGVGLTTSVLAKKSATLSQLLQQFLSSKSVARRHVGRIDLVTRPMACPLLMGARTGRRTINGVLFVGDAADLVDPLSGQGIAYALESGRAAAAAVSLALHTGNRNHLARYPLGVFLDFVPEMVSARALRSLLSRPWGNSIVVRVLQRDESLARAGIAILGGSIPAYWILRPRLAEKVIAPRHLASVMRADHPAAGTPA